MSINDDIFNLGIDSISIMKVVHQIKLKTDIDMPGSVLSENNSIKLIADYIDNFRKSKDDISERKDYYVVQDKIENEHKH